VIALSELSHADGLGKLVSKVLQAVSQPYSINGLDVSITASIGVSIYPTNGEEVETLMKCADMALYEAKRNGNNDYRIAARTEQLAMARI
jgi:two-component system cell cycle response regulator